MTEACERAFVMFAAILDQAREGAGARVLDHAITSGEATKMVAEVAAAFGSRSASHPETTQNAKEAPVASGEIRASVAEVDGVSSKGRSAQPEVDQPGQQVAPGTPSTRPLLQPEPTAPSNGNGPST